RIPKHVRARGSIAGSVANYRKQESWDSQVLDFPIHDFRIVPRKGNFATEPISGSAAAGRALEGESLRKDFLSEGNLKNVRGLAAIAKNRGQTLAQMAIAWVLRDDRVTSALIGARNVDQLDDSLDALKKQEFSAEELGEIDQFAKEGGIDLWRETSEL